MSIEHNRNVCKEYQPFDILACDEYEEEERKYFERIIQEGSKSESFLEDKLCQANEDIKEVRNKCSTMQEYNYKLEEQNRKLEEKIKKLNDEYEKKKDQLFNLHSQHVRLI